VKNYEEIYQNNQYPVCELRDSDYSTSRVSVCHYLWFVRFVEGCCCWLWQAGETPH